MGLADVPIVLTLAGLVAYSVLGGADFGAGLWQVGAGRGQRGRDLREHTHHAMAPVWEANHVWLIFVLVVCWTAYPRAFGSIASTLAVPLFIAAVGIILRGTSYAVRSVGLLDREEPIVRAVFVSASVLTPFALGTVIGAIASRRVLVGNARGDLWTTWTGATPLLVGALTVATAAYLAAVYLAADAAREGRAELVAAFRTRALGAGLVAGALALAGLAVLHEDARRLFDGLTSGSGLAAVVASALAGGLTLVLLLRGRYEAARYTSAAAVATIVIGWALAQQPELLPGLSVHKAAASHQVLVAVVIGAAIGFVVLAPSLGLLFGMVLRGRFDTHAAGPAPAPEPPRPAAAPSTGRPELAAAILFGFGVLLTVFGEGLVLAMGIVLLLASVAWGFLLLVGPASFEASE